MSQASALLLAALVGALITLAGTAYARLRDQFNVRVGALRVLLEDLAQARQRMNKSLETGSVWPADEQVVPNAWTDYRSTLASHLTPETWDKVQALVPRLQKADRRAAELRAPGSVLDDQFRAELKGLADEIGVTTSKYAKSIAEQLNDGVIGARRLPNFVAVAMAIGVAAIIVVGLVLTFHKPTWTADRLESTLKTQDSGAEVVACDASTQLEGGYTCTAAFPSCALGRFSANRHNTCSPPLEITYNVQTQKQCFVANGSVDPPPPSLQERLSKFLRRWACKRP